MHGGGQQQLVSVLFSAFLLNIVLSLKTFSSYLLLTNARRRRTRQRYIRDWANFIRLTAAVVSLLIGTYLVAKNTGQVDLNLQHNKQEDLSQRSKHYCTMTNISKVGPRSIQWRNGDTGGILDPKMDYAKKVWAK